MSTYRLGWRSVNIAFLDSACAPLDSQDPFLEPRSPKLSSSRKTVPTFVERTAPYAGSEDSLWAPDRRLLPPRPTARIISLAAPTVAPLKHRISRSRAGTTIISGFGSTDAAKGAQSVQLRRGSWTWSPCCLHRRRWCVLGESVPPPHSRPSNSAPETFLLRNRVDSLISHSADALPIQRRRCRLAGPSSRSPHHVNPRGALYPRPLKSSGLMASEASDEPHTEVIASLRK
ncbi:hypothetical protein MBM_00948 [Drepanopeziza brunnea f. sp. 'multigermtubi' MB_m1]|uniref:Uncharacterized protein n=1 Tax=Marssonina brunnea f. sp. multigermtubi (strain MB_m1) TaxID=1072389 RepID=K1X521_MARBU|nr:uncharacterized protein MBM_00948 [Drepanopeziza brunnea f. sp. 'multigermtubi' MB_m1]EKD20266.1 hypothetical protein MBM_00948 [Drepanopeziza brunnea f. sp. 'multigermtubi' MB_m1]